MKISAQGYLDTYHLPWSKSIQPADKVLHSIDHFYGKMVVVTENIEGDLFTLGANSFYTSKKDIVPDWNYFGVQQLHSLLQHDISTGITLVGGNLFTAKKISCFDNSLAGYFYLATIWENILGGKEDYCLDYDDIVEYANFFNLVMPKVLYRGIFDKHNLIDIANKLDGLKIDGYILRTVDGFMRHELNKCVARYASPPSYHQKLIN